MTLKNQSIRLASQVNPRLIISLLSGPDYRYKYRVPIDIGLTIRNEKLDRIRVGAGALLENPIQFMLRNRPLGPPEGDVVNPFPKPTGLQRVGPLELGYSKVNSKDLSVKIYLAGEETSISGDPYITIFFTPTEIDYQVVSEMKSLGIIGADLQTYHYGGSEETLVFDISWMGLKGSPEGSALEKARRFADLSQSGKWPSRRPPIITMVWGSGENTPFLDEYFIVEKAPFKPRLFALNKHSRNSSGNIFDPKGISIEPNDFHPQYVLQTVTLKRVR